MNEIPYASAIGSIMYFMIYTWPDVLYALSATIRYLFDPDGSHWVSIKNICKYVRRTKDPFLIYEGREEIDVIWYTKVIFQTNKDDFRSQYGYVFFLNVGAMSLKSLKQNTVVDFTIKAMMLALWL